MKQKRTIRSVNLPMILASAIVLALALIIVPKQATAQVVCPTLSTADSDRDGFTDAQECLGIILIDGNAFPNGTRTILSCTAGGTAQDRSNCVDPNSRDAFVIVTRASPTRIPLDPYKFTSALPSVGGLGITIHEINTSRTDRVVTNQIADGSIGAVLWPQLAARLRESLDTSDVILGSANQGIALDSATVFTLRIANFVNSVCVAGIACVDSNSAATGVDTAPEVIELYIRHTIAHELGGHILTLARFITLVLAVTITSQAPTS